MFGASRRQVFAMALGAVPLLGGDPPPVSLDGVCVELNLKKRNIKICPHRPDKHGLLSKALFIDGVPLKAMKHRGKFSSALNLHVAHPSLKHVAAEAVELLGGAKLLNQPPLPPVKVIQPAAPCRSSRRAGAVRKNAAAMTAAERATVVEAFLTLKQDGTYDYFVDLHRRAFDNHGWNAHQHAGFLAWHRALLLLFESNLGTALPYWDWSTQQSAGAAPFTSDFLGGNGRAEDGQVMDGPFAYRNGQWPITVREDTRQYLRRELGTRAARPSGPSVVSQALAVTTYDRSPYDASATGSFRNLVEGWPSGPSMHNRAHVWVGGTMLPASSPNDPAFFLNHCYVDKIWSDWQARNSSVAHFLPSTLLDVPLEPFRSEVGWTITPRQLLNHSSWYTYGGAPTL